jgi:RNA polymerase sigma-70 factor (ECF subfamily)
MEIYKRYGRALLRKAERLLQNREDAEDIVQGLFVDMWKQGQAKADLPYLYRAVTNRCLNYIRDHSNRQRLLERQEPALRGTPRTSCEEHVIALEVLLQLAETLDRKCVEVLVYRFFDDMSQEEIAHLTRTTRKTVARRLKKIHSRVYELMGRSNGWPV